MAHAARINELTQSLVFSITDRSRDDAAFKQLQDHVVRGLRKSNYVRTNQFDVKSKLDGLVEKFAVLDRDELAEALQTRLDELPTKSKWLPEILSLFLHLSDRPVEHTTIEDLESLSQRLGQDLPQLIWEGIIADDPLDDPGIWDDVERGYHSSGDDVTVDDVGDSDDSTQATSIGEDDVASLARLHIVQPNSRAFDILKEARERESGNLGHKVLSELTLIRETLQMLQGLPTSIYILNWSSGAVSLNYKQALTTATRLVINDLMSQFVEMGSSINVLRHWIRTKQTIAYLQSCQAVLQQRLMGFGSELAAMEQRYLAPVADTVVSIIDVRNDVERIAKPLIELSRIVENTCQKMKPAPFELLDDLYDQACASQMSGDRESFTILTDMLFIGLETYLRPVSSWTQTGFVDTKDTTFLVTESNALCEPGRLWHDRYALRTLGDGRPSAPSLIHRYMRQIYALGKSRAFLATLSNSEELRTQVPPGGPDFASLQDMIHRNNLLPFSQIIADSLDSWISETAKDCTPLLRNNLLYESGLLRTMRGLDEAFCSKDGRLFQTFADTLFWRMDAHESWRDSFLLTELAESTLGSAPNVDGESLSVSFSSEDWGTFTTSSIRQLGDVLLQSVFSWPLQNITCSRTSSAHVKAFAFLLQVYRAKYLLQRQLFSLRPHNLRTTQLTKDINVALRLRQHLLFIVDVLHAHLTNTACVLGSSTRQGIESVDDIDAMAAIWAEYQSRLETSLLLAQKLQPVREAVTGVLELCEQFALVWNRLLAAERGDDRVSQDDHDEDESKESDAAEDDPEFHGSQANVRDFQIELGKSRSFIVAGVRGVSRAGGNTALELLAESLEWSVQ